MLDFPYYIAHLHVPLPSAIIFPSVHLYHNFSTFGRDFRFGHCVGLDCWRQCWSSKCLPVSPLLSPRVKLHRCRTDGLFLPTGHIAAFTISANVTDGVKAYPAPSDP